MEELAINGGKPVREKMLPYGRQTIDEKDIQAVVDVLRSDFLTTGPEIDKFEHAVAQKLGVKYAVAISNGTAALHACIFAANIGKNDEIITSPITFAASSNCVLYQGGLPRFADIDAYSHNIDPANIEQYISPNTKAIIPVDFTGRPSELDEIQDIAKKHGLIVIEDAAHALGAVYKNRKVGSISDLTILSFHPVKHITTGEGGMILTNNPEYYERLKLFRAHGITRNTDLMTKNEGGWFYQQLELGYNYRITDIQCALGISQLEKLDDNIKVRKKIVDYYYKELYDVPGIVLPPKDDEDHKSAWHLYTIWIDEKKLKAGRKFVYDALRAENIGVNVHYIPVYYHPYYRNIGYSKTCCNNAEKFYSGEISLPIFYGMTESDSEDVVTAIKKIVNSALHELT